jgi:hypothetical protein
MLMTARPIVAFLCSSALFAADLPVRNVILYKHGVGYFERSGPLSPGEHARLDFKSSEMDDVLKSLTVTEGNGATVAGLRYDSSVPLNQKLAGFPFQLLAGQPLTALLDQLKGAQIELTIGGKPTAGAIVSARLVPGDKDRGERQQITLLLDNGMLSTYELAETTGMRFTDPQLQLQFKDYLAALLAGRSQEKRSVYIDSTDKGTREIHVRYMIPAPMWKSSYRLIFPDKGEPTLEGWGIVDNTTGEDWTNVRLALVSGKPISFLFPLYEPRMVARNMADLPEEAAVGPMLHGVVIGGVVGGVPTGASSGKAFSIDGRLRAGMNGQMNSVEVQSDMASISPGSMGARPPALPSSIETISAREVADLFEYDMERPVTVRKDESAMLPFLQQKVTARKLLIYSDPNAVNPQNAAEITNITGKTLDGGPITIFDGGSYAGEALVETVKAGDRRLISYAVDLGTRVTTKLEAKNVAVREIHMQRGMLTTRYSQQWTRTYTIQNIDSKAKTLIVEQPIRPEWELVGRRPKEVSAKDYRFEVALAPNGSASLPVTEENVYSQSVSVSNYSPDGLLAFAENKELNAAGRQQLKQILDLKRRIAHLESDRRATTDQISSAIQDQNRLREILMSLNQVPGQQAQVQKYATDLATRETKVAALRSEQQSLADQQKAIEAELNDKIATVQF